MNDKKEMTARTSSVGADERQSVQNTISSISAFAVSSQWTAEL